MKKLFLLGIFMGAIGSAHASMKYECWTYVGGKPDKMTAVVANSKSEAVELSTAKFRDMGVRFDYVQCK